MCLIETYDQSLLMIGKKYDQSIRLIDQRYDQSIRLIDQRYDQSLRIAKQKYHQSLRMINQNMIMKYIRLKIKPNSVRIRFLRLQLFLFSLYKI